jgi:hypothetical protein
VNWFELEHAVIAESGSAPRLIVLIYEISPIQNLLAIVKYMHCDFGDFPQVIQVLSCVVLKRRLMNPNPLTASPPSVFVADVPIKYFFKYKMAAKNFTVSHFLKICIEDNLLPYPSDTVSFIHDLNYGYQG